MEAIQKFKASRNLNETELIHKVHEHAQEELPPTIDEGEFEECQQFNTDQDLEPPTDDILEFITSQGHSEDQEKAMKARLSLTPGTPRFIARRLENEEDKVNA